MKNNINFKNINYDNFLENNHYVIINDLDDDYISQFIQFEQNKMLEEFKDANNEDFKVLEYKINFPSEKNMKYITNFELVDQEIKDFFIKYNIAKEEHFIKLHFLSKNGKILIIFEKDKNNFYELGHFNDNEDFIIEYLIDELENISKEDIAKYFLDNGINSFINDPKESQNVIKLNNWLTKNKKFIYYKLEEKENSKEIINNQSLIVNNINNIDNNDDIINIKFIKDIFFILSSIFIFEKNIIKNSIQKSYKDDCILLSNKFSLSSNL